MAGAGLLVASAAIHLDLYLTGYREIRTIGPMFLAQVVAALVLAAALLATIPVMRAPVGRLVASAGAAFALGTLGGYLLSVHFGLFGFQEVETTAGVVAGAVEIAAFGLLGLDAVGGLAVAGRRAAVSLVGPLTTVAAVLLVLVELGAPSPAAASPAAASRGGAKGEVTVVIKDFEFHPSDPVARPGERIAVTNEDSVTHTFTGTGKAAFDSGPIPPHTTKDVLAPRRPGRYRFFCLIHQYMTGTLIVSKG